MHDDSAEEPPVESSATDGAAAVEADGGSPSEQEVHEPPSGTESAPAEDQAEGIADPVADAPVPTSEATTESSPDAQVDGRDAAAAETKAEAEGVAAPVAAEAQEENGEVAAEAEGEGGKEETEAETNKGEEAAGEVPKQQQEEPGEAKDEVDEEEDEDEDGSFEATVPAEWQRVMSTRALREASPLPLGDLLSAIGELVESKVKLDAADLEPGQSRASMPSHVWQWATEQHGAHKLAEAALASIVKGVEASWRTHKSVRLLGELCGMVKEPHEEAVNRRVLGLVPSLCDAAPIAPTLVGEGEKATVPVSRATSAIASLDLSEPALEKLDAFTAADAAAPRLDVLLVALMAPVRELVEDAAGEAAGGAAAGEGEAAGAPIGEASGVGGGAASAAAGWLAMAAKLPVGKEERVDRRAVFDVCTAASTMEAEEARAGLMRHLQPGETQAELLSAAIEDGFERAEEAAEASAPCGAGPGSLGRWGFYLLIVYVRQYIELLLMLERAAEGRMAAPVSADEFATVCGRVAEWGVVVDDAAAAYGALCGGGELAFGVFAAWCLKLSLATLTADCLEAATLENEGGLAADGAALLPPPEPLDPVLEDSERSFSATDLGSVKRGFYDAAEADAASEDVKRELSSKLEEQTSRLEEALAELEKLRTEREEQDRKIGTVLEANDAMERQLKELNAVVEGVVKRELQRVKTVNEARAGRHGGRDPRSRFGR